MSHVETFTITEGGGGGSLLDDQIARRGVTFRRLFPVDLDGGGIDDEVGDILGGEVAMEPEAVAAGLVAGADGGRVGEGEAALGAGDLALEGIEAARRDGDATWGLGGRSGERQAPGVPSQLEGEVERGGGGCGTILVVGR